MRFTRLLEIDSKCCICKQTVGPCRSSSHGPVILCKMVKAVSMWISTRFAQERHIPIDLWRAGEAGREREARASTQMRHHGQANAIWPGCDVVCVYSDFTVHSMWQTQTSAMIANKKPFSRKQIENNGPQQCSGRAARIKAKMSV